MSDESPAGPTGGKVAELRMRGSIFRVSHRENPLHRDLNSDIKSLNIIARRCGKPFSKGPEERTQAMIPESHPLQELFTELVHHHFDREIGLHDNALQDYVASVLIEFCECEQLFKIRNVNDRPLEDVGEMLLESDPIYGPAPSFDRERQVRKHIGDYTLFLSGMFPESINHFRLRHARLENFVDFLKAGKESYFIVSKFDQFEYTKLAPLFAKLAHEFESCVYGLNLVKSDLQEMQHPITQQAKEIIM